MINATNDQPPENRLPGIELQLVTAIAGLQADMRHIRETGDRTHDAVNGLAGRVSNLEAEVSVVKARQTDIGPELQSMVAALHERSEAQKQINATFQSVLDTRSLSWPKLLTGLGAVVGVLVALGLFTP